MDHIKAFMLEKLAREAQVKAHARVQGGKVVIVDRHDRTIEGTAPVRPTIPSGRTPAQEAALRAKQEAELKLWETWRDSDRAPDDLQPLLQSFAPMIKSKSVVYLGKVRIPPSAIELAFKREFVNGLAAYDPSKGSLGTYMYKYLDKAKRWIVENQNTGRIPENRIYKITAYHRAVELLTEETGEPPSDQQLADQLGWSVAEVDRMSREDRSDLVSQVFEEDPNSISPSKTMEVLKLFKYELEGDQRAVFEHLMGFGRPQIQGTGEIAATLGIKDYQVSRLKLQIKSKMEQYLRG